MSSSAEGGVCGVVSAADKKPNMSEGMRVSPVCTGMVQRRRSQVGGPAKVTSAVHARWLMSYLSDGKTTVALYWHHRASPVLPVALLSQRHHRHEVLPEWNIQLNEATAR